VVIVVVIFH
jgi:hypothetical protein